jgi:peptide-methionine (S)-S-oxide reductase
MKISMILLFSMFNVLAGCSQTKTKNASHPGQAELARYSQATFAAGCFWHEEAMFESIKGVKEAVSGYAGGNTKSPTYESIEDGTTGHAETVNVYYDSTQIDYATLLKIYFAGQDATQVNGQGPDEGTQYRSIVFYRNDAEKTQVQKYMKELQPKYKAPLAAQVMAFTKFWPAEDYHQDYIERNPNQGYVQSFSIPEIRKLQKQFPALVKPGHQF